MFSLKSAIICRQRSTYQPLSPSHRPIWTQKTETATRIRQKIGSDLRLDNRPRVSIRRQSCAVEERIWRGSISLSSKNKPLSATSQLFRSRRSRSFASACELPTHFLLRSCCFSSSTAVRSGEAKRSCSGGKRLISRVTAGSSPAQSEEGAQKAHAVPLSEPAIQILKIRSAFSRWRIRVWWQTLVRYSGFQAAETICG